MAIVSGHGSTVALGPSLQAGHAKGMDEVTTWYVVPLDDGWLVKERTATQGEMLGSKAAAVARAEANCRRHPPGRYLVRRADGTIETEARPTSGPEIETVCEVDLRPRPSERARRARGHHRSN